MTMKEILNSTKTIAIIGLSSSPYRTSHRIGKYLLDAGFTIIPVNPNEESVFGLKSYLNISDVPGNIEIDMIDIFRNSRYSADMVQQIVNWSESSGQKPVIWTQIGVSSDEAKRIADKNGFTYIEDKCLMVEHGRVS
ncbi:CoA-binding protein [Rhodohalobacter sp. WB101]|uniref:CoA-binding protein n=2 Tax=Rhodohalobacter sulfatireducens TaxID=2911366 RepID=A0ABS9KD54_9BACT|nr:CoA-binding protein [Rhodohalobacter sulfatireducens]